jgi:hypothetical protein
VRVHEFCLSSRTACAPNPLSCHGAVALWRCSVLHRHQINRRTANQVVLRHLTHEPHSPGGTTETSLLLNISKQHLSSPVLPCHALQQEAHRCALWLRIQPLKTFHHSGLHPEFCRNLSLHRSDGCLATGYTTASHSRSELNVSSAWLR